MAPRRLGAYIVHTGVLVTCVAIAISSSYQIDTEATLEPGGTMTVGDYALPFQSSRLVEEPHKTS